MRVLVTGASGFVGRNAIAPLLQRGFEVHALAHRASPIDVAGVSWHRADLLQQGTAMRLMREIAPTHLLHLGWYAEPGKFWTARENLLWVGATLELIDAFAQAGGRRFTGVGTCAEYDWSEGTCIEGVTPLAPSSLYGTAKLSAWQIIRSYADSCGLSAAWGRLFFMYGPHEHPSRLVAYVIRSLLRGEVARCTTGEHARDFLYVVDGGDALAALLASDVRGAVNIGSGTAVEIRAVVSRIADALGLRHRVALGAIPPRQPEPPLLVASTKRLSGDVGWQPRFSLDDGLSRTIVWWREQER